MILYLYALADRLDGVDDLTGVGGEALTVVDVPEARLAAGWLPSTPSVDRITLEAQDRVIRELHRRVQALLPMRFGTMMDSVDAAIRAVDIISAGLRARFDLVRGREQMCVRVLRSRTQGAMEARGTEGAQAAVTEGADGAGEAGGVLGVGAAYLRARAMQDIPPAIVPLLDATRVWQRATRIERGQHDVIVGTVYQLIDRGQAEVYREAVLAAAARLPAITIRVTGPSPAYAFA